MRTPALLLAGFAALATQASARSDTDYPHRDWGKVVTLDMSVVDATACIMRELGRSADVTVIPADGGNDIDVAPHLMWGRKSEPWQTYQIRDQSGITTMRAFYRHPVKQSAIDKEVAKLQKFCLNATKIEAITES